MIIQKESNFVLKAVLVVMYDDNSKGECWAYNGMNGVRMTVGL